MKILKHGKIYAIKKKKSQVDLEKADKTRNKVKNIIIYKDELVEPLAPIWFDTNIKNSKDALVLIYQSVSEEKVYFNINGTYDYLYNDEAWAFINFLRDELMYSDKQYQKFIAKNAELVTTIFEKLDNAFGDAMDREYINSEIESMLRRVIVDKENINEVEMFL